VDESVLVVVSEVGLGELNAGADVVFDQGQAFALQLLLALEAVLTQALFVDPISIRNSKCYLVRLSVDSFESIRSFEL
jgi:hypothetical protein